MINIALFGLGEAGGLIGSDIAHSGKAKNIDVQLLGYDPANVKTPDGVARKASAVETVENADFVLSFTASIDAKTAGDQAIRAIPNTAVYADFASASAGLKRELAVNADNEGFSFCNVALMAMVPGNGIKTPAMLAGNGAEKLSSLLSQFGMPVDIVSSQAGDAAERKLLRSVVIKGFAGLLVEALEGAQQAGCEQWLWQNLVDQFAVMDQSMLKRLVEGTAVHAERRFHEMEASAQQLIELNIEPLMTQSTVSSLAKIKRMGVPAVPKLNS